MDPLTEDALKILKSTDRITKLQKNHIGRLLEAVYSLNQKDDRKAVNKLRGAYGSMYQIPKEIRQETLKYFEKYDMEELDGLCKEIRAKRSKLELATWEIDSPPPRSPTRYLRNDVIELEIEGTGVTHTPGEVDG